jgi:hypothetical protein
MTLFIAGVVLFAAVLGLFHAKDSLRSPRLARLADSELVMRLTVVAVALIVFGGMIALGEWLG